MTSFPDRVSNEIVNVITKMWKLSTEDDCSSDSGTARLAFQYHCDVLLVVNMERR